MGDPLSKSGILLRGGITIGAFFASGMNPYVAMAVSTLIAAYDTRNILTPTLDPLQDGVVRQQQGMQINQIGTEVSLPIVYGKAKIGVSFVDVRSGAGQSADYGSPNTLCLVGAICLASEGSAVGGTALSAQQGIEDISIIYFNDQDAIEAPGFGTNDATNNPTVWSGSKVRSPFNGGETTASGKTFGTHYYLDYFIHQGLDAQLVDYRLKAEFPTPWSTYARGVGVSYMVLWCYYKDDIWTNGVPNVTLTLKGNRVPDVSDLSAAYRYSTNPADCIYDYMTSTRYGMGIPAAKMDATSFAAAGAYCDESVTVTLSSGTATLLDRFTCNGFLDSSQPPMRNLEKLLSSCCGSIVYENGKYKLLIKEPKAVESFELNRTNIVGDWQFVKTGIDQTPNTLSTTFIDVDQNYQPQEVSWPEPTSQSGTDNAYLVEDNDYKVDHRLELPFTENHYMAQMIASRTFLESRADMACTVVAQREALKLSCGDIVNVTHDTPGWTDQPMWVEGVALRRDGLVDLVLKEYSSAAYTVPTMTVKSEMVAAGLPPRFEVTNPSTVQTLNVVLNPVHDTGYEYDLSMTLTFSTGMGSYRVVHNPAAGVIYSYTVDYTGVSTTVDLLQNPAAGTNPFQFSADPSALSGQSSITISPYPSSGGGGNVGTAITVTFQIDADE